MKNWSRMYLSTKGKKLILKALIQSRAMYLAITNEMSKDIIERMTTQMKSFLWDSKRPLMNWRDTTEPNKKRGLNIPDIEVYTKTIQIM